jgi:hypothetical protein
MMSSKLFRDRMILIGVILVSWLGLLFVGTWAFLLFIPALGALLGTVALPSVRPKPEKPIKMRNWFIIRASLSAVALTISVMIAILWPSNSETTHSPSATELIAALISFALTITSIFWLFQLGREAYRAVAARYNQA